MIHVRKNPAHLSMRLCMNPSKYVIEHEENKNCCTLKVADDVTPEDGAITNPSDPEQVLSVPSWLAPKLRKQEKLA